MKNPKDMSNSEIDTELAERRGWNTIDDGGWWTGFKTHWHPTESLDQCHVIEDYLDELRETNHRLTCIPALRYADHLRIIVGAKGKLYFAYDLIHATARQKSEALLMTLREVENV